MNNRELAELIVRSSRGSALRYMNKRWWVYDDGFWIQDHGSIRVDSLIRAVCRQEGHIKGLNLYAVNQIRAEMSAYLIDDRLPGRTAPPDRLRPSDPSL